MPADAPLPRLWWLKRLTIAIGGMLGLMAGSYWAVHLWADRRIALEVAYWRELPVIQPEETLGTPADRIDTRNPASHIDRALAAVRRPTPEQALWSAQTHRWPPLSAEDVEMIARYERDSAAAFAALRQSRDPAVDRPFIWAMGPIRAWTLLPHLNPIRELSNRLGWSILLAHHQGDLPRAIEYAHDHRRLAEAAIRYGPSLISAQVATTSELEAHRRLRVIAGHVPDHRTLDEELGLWREAAPAVRRLIDELLDEEFAATITPPAPWDTEWLVILSTRDPPPGEEMMIRNLLTAPILDAMAARHLARLRLQWEAIDPQASYQQQQAALARIPEPREPATVAGIAAAHPQYSARNSERTLRTFALARTSCGVTAISLASRLFEAEHGRLPATLDELVPDYLPRLPIDPFDPQGLPLRYIVIEGVPFVYSVGPDGIDQGGSSRNPESPHSDDPDQIYAEDYLYPLRFTE